MSNKQQYTAEDIRLYLEGKLTPAEMHALEKAALHDPFLADAIEGMRSYGNNEKFAGDVDELHMRLHQRTGRRKGSVAYSVSLLLKVAAILFIVVTGVAVILFTSKDTGSDSQLAATENVRQKTSVPDTSAADAAASASILTDTNAQTLAATKEHRKPVTPSRKKSAPAESAQAEEERSASTPSAPANSRKAEPENRTEVADGVPANAEKQAEVAESLQGRAAGVDIAKSEDNDSIYEEVVVVGVGNSRARTMNNAKALSSSQAKRRVMPENGWDEFQQYMQDSLSITTADSIYTGEEELTFTIGPDGQPQSIKILRSVSPSHDKEAIRLLQNGPAWKVVKGRRRYITLKLIF
jgi:hypothetical protein